MQITLTKEQVKEAFGELRFMGADNCYRYDKDSKKKTEEVEALKLHLGSMKLDRFDIFGFLSGIFVITVAIISSHITKFPEYLFDLFFC